MGATVNYPAQTKVTVGDTGGLVSVTTAGAVGPQGPAGPEGPVGVPNFYETSNPPLGAAPGDQWIVTTSIGE